MKKKYLIIIFAIIILIIAILIRIFLINKANQDNHIPKLSGNEVINEVEQLPQNEQIANSEEIERVIFESKPKEKEEQKPQRTVTYLDNYEIKGVLNIPKINCNYPILERVTVDSLSKSVAILDIFSSTDEDVNDVNVPGSNVIIYGHNYRNGMFFSNNHELSKGDIIQITDQFGITIDYEIYDIFYTTPEDANYMVRDIDPDVREITLQTCNDDSSKRLIICAKDK